MPDGFKDHFSAQADQYARYRPGYPDELFERLAGLAPARRFAWDVATGNGQAAFALAKHFERVVANDASAAQIAKARPHERVTYLVARAEDVELEKGSVDLVTCAQALHWFAGDAFYARVKHALAPAGVFAAWSYGLQEYDEPLNGIIFEFYDKTVGPYWPPERVHVEQGYRTLPFPFREIDIPPTVLTVNWTVDEVAGYLRSWSATQRFIGDRGFDPVPDLIARAAPHWGEPGAVRRIRWPLTVRAGRVG